MYKYRLLKKLNRTLCFVLLLFFVFFAIFPVFLVFINSFKSSLDLNTYPPRILADFTLDNYKHLAEDNPRFMASLKNSVIVTGGALILTLLIAFPAAFVFSRHKSRYLKFPALFLMIVRMFPPIVITIPLYPILRSLGMIDKHFTLIIINTAFSISLAVFMMKAFIDDIPVELEEAAMLEGCTKWKSFVKITLPLAGAGITAIAIFVAIGVWNEYTFAYIFSMRRAITAPVVITTIESDVMGINYGALFASCVLHLLPMLILIIVIHKYLVKGMATGAIK